MLDVWSRVTSFPFVLILMSHTMFCSFSSAQYITASSGLDIMRHRKKSFFPLVFREIFQKLSEFESVGNGKARNFHYNLSWSCWARFSFAMYIAIMIILIHL